MMAFGTVATIFFNVLHVTRMGEDNIAALVVQPKTNGQLFRWGWCKLTAEGQKRQHTADNGDGYVTFFQDSVLVLRFDATKDRMLHSSIHPHKTTTQGSFFPSKACLNGTPIQLSIFCKQKSEMGFKLNCFAQNTPVKPRSSESHGRRRK